MTLALHDQGWSVNHKRTRRLMRLMGLEAVYPRPRLSSNGGAHLRFPYLLKGLLIEHRNQVWCSDITYIGLAEGFVYLFALMDCYEEVYLREYDSVTEAWRSIGRYFSFYNDQRPHSSLANRSPAAVYNRIPTKLRQKVARKNRLVFPAPFEGNL